MPGAARFINLGGCDALAQQFHMPQFCIEDVLALSGARLAGCGHYGLEEIGPKFERQAKDIFSMVLESPARWAALVRLAAGCRCRRRHPARVRTAAAEGEQPVYGAL